MTPAGSNFAFKIAAKPLQTWLLLILTDFRNSSSPYPTVPSPTLYDVRFSHNTCRETDIMYPMLDPKKADKPSQDRALRDSGDDLDASD